MQKLFTTVLLVLMLVLPLFAFSQNPALQTIHQNDIDVLNCKMQKSLKKCKCYSKKDSVQLFTFFSFLTMDTISKEEYEDGSFLQKLTPIFGYQYDIRLDHIDTISKEFEDGYVIRNIKDNKYYYFSKSKKDSLLSAYHFIFSKKRNIIATFSGHDNRFICRKKGKESYYTKLYTELIKSIWDKENLFVFQMIEKRSGHYFFIVNEQLEISVFHYDFNDENYKILPIKEFIDKNWEKFYKANSGVLVG